MNILELIKNQIKQIVQIEKSIFLDAVISHLERAERYYSLGEDDDNYYNDVIYRTNQAFEGALKEAYKILAGKSESEVTKETPYKIEKFFEDNGIFKVRVLELFKNYRSEWRNKSTHDYKLFFDNNEAFIAISSVSSFAYLLLNQILEKIAFDHQKSKIEQSKNEILKIKEDGLKVARRLFEIISMLFSETINYGDLTTKHPLEAQLIGFLKANLNSFLPYVVVKEEPNIGKNLRPDFLIELDSERVILEVKKFSKQLDSALSVQQLLTYLEHAQIEHGIVLALDISKSFKPMTIIDHKVESNNLNYTIRVISN
ncbi:GxxExxY protein [Chitinophaga sp. RAB17]|uniref:GxxExxY protein n=1 Tax=Chitinophaga sp. RAB17 TaxID=3233049 RepID=UPI003F8EFECF